MSFFESGVSVEEAVKKVHAGEISAKSLVEKSLKTIHEKNSKINAFITICDDLAIKTAEILDNLNTDEKKKLPLCGIPIALKDNICVKGIRMTCASKMLENFVPNYDAHIVEKLKKAGAVIIGKTNMDEFAMGSSNETSFFGAVKNPHDNERVSGGSSGGSAAAVAADMVPLAIGSDTGGSVRQPASLCGIVGLKPTYGLVSRLGLAAVASSLDAIGPMANSVEDVEYLLRIIATADKRDGTHCGKNYQRMTEKNIKDAVIGLPKEYLSNDLPKDTRVLFDEKVKYLKDKGAKFVDITLGNIKEAVAAYCVIADAEISSNFQKFDGVRFGYRSPNSKVIDDLYKNTRAEGFGEEVKRRIIFGTFFLSTGNYDKYYIKAMQVRTLINKSFEEAFSKCNAILSPITLTPAFKFGEVSDPVQMYLQDSFAVSASLTGCSAISLPMGKIGGLPIGIQIMAQNFKGEYAFAIAKELEKSN